MRYRQHKSDGTQIEAYWLTDFPARKTSSRTLYTCAKARWEIENQGFNEGNNHHGFEHIPHHHANSLFIHWPPTSIQLLRRLRLALTAPPFCDSS